MYFYIHKKYKNEKIKLLEMCNDTRVNFRNGTFVHSINLNAQILKKLRIEISATFLF